jgi:hypothetical protein
MSLSHIPAKMVNAVGEQYGSSITYCASRGESVCDTAFTMAIGTLFARG